MKTERKKPVTGHVVIDPALPLISCICLTYRRPVRDQYLLEESIESFQRQTYPNKELIILNDCPGQILACDAPNVRVYNAPNRFNSVGEKRNLAVALARGDVLAPWDDDDISLPWRLELSLELLGHAEYSSPGMIWLSRDRLMQRPPVRFLAKVASIFTRTGFQEVGGYRAISFGEDLRFDEDLRTYTSLNSYADANGYELPPGDIFYLYRAGASGNHLSRAHNPFRWDEIGSRPIDQGHFTLHPHWRTDYVALTRRQVEVRRLGAAGDENADDVTLLVGGMPRLEATPPELRRFPLPDATEGESAADHLRRVQAALQAAMALGGTHLMIAPEHEGWLARYPDVLDYLTSHHDLLTDASRHALMYRLRKGKASRRRKKPADGEVASHRQANAKARKASKP